MALHYFLEMCVRTLATCALLGLLGESSGPRFLLTALQNARLQGGPCRSQSSQGCAVRRMKHEHGP